MNEFSEQLNAAVRLADEAGAAVMRVYGRDDFEVEHKDDDSPLTAADRASHEVLERGLAEMAPAIPLLSEEGAAIAFETRRAWDRYWLIDPLDGTKEFIKRNGEFTVNIALIEDGRAVLGVVHAPALGATYCAEAGTGAFKRTAGRPGWERIAVAAPPAGAPWRVVASRSHRGEAVDALLACLGEHEIVSMGSSLKLCLVADGSADLYPRLGPTSEWDTAAAQCVVEEAGGQVLERRTLQRLPYNSKESLLNPEFIVCAGVNDEWTRCL